MRNWSISASALSPRPESPGREQAAPHAALVLLRGHQQVVAHRHLAEHLQGLEGAAHTQLVELLRRLVGDVLAVELDLAGVGRDLAQHAVEHRGLARAVGPITPKISPGMTSNETPPRPGWRRRPSGGR
jgi:hypothetical protein